MTTIISAFPLNPTPVDPRTSKTKMITATMRQTPTTTPPPSPHPAPSPPSSPLPTPPAANQSSLIATLFASQPFDLVQGSQVQIGWKSAEPLYSVSIRLMRQNPTPAKTIETWPDVLPGINTVTVAMPTNENFNQTVRLELWCTNTANPIFPIACLKSSSFVIFPVVAGLPTLITNLPDVTTPHLPSLLSPEPTNHIDEGTVSSFMSSTGALIGLISLSLVVVAVFGCYFWKHCRENRRARRESEYYDQMRRKGLSPAPWNLTTNRNRVSPPGLIISPPSPTSTVRSTTASSSVGSNPAVRDVGPPWLGLFEQTVESTLPLPTSPPIVPLQPPLLPFPIPLPPPPVRPRRPSVVPSLPTWSQRSESIVYLDTQRSNSFMYLNPDTDDDTESETSSFYSRVLQHVPDKEEYYSSASSSMTSSSSSGSSLDLDAFLLQLSQTPPAPTRSNESHLLVLRSDQDQEPERKQTRNPYGYF